MAPLLEIEHLNVDFAMRRGNLRAVSDVSLALDMGERLGLVGESGAGKSVLGFSIINLISKPGFIASGSIRFQGKDISTYSDEQMRHVRGNRISMIFQDPMMTLNPVLTVGDQMRETLYAHGTFSKAEATRICIEKVAEGPDSVAGKAFESNILTSFSGGMRQRIVIAISLLTDPNLIIADEPTTGAGCDHSGRDHGPVAGTLQNGADGAAAHYPRSGRRVAGDGADCRHVRGNHRRTGTDRGHRQPPQPPPIRKACSEPFPSRLRGADG